MNNSRIAPCDRLKIIIGELEYLQDLEYNISFGMSSYGDQVDGFSEVTKKLFLISRQKLQIGLRI